MSREIVFRSLQGRTLMGRYRLGDVLGVGGYGAVFAAEDELLRRDVAIKVLRHDPEDEDNSGRFLREARVLARIQHPNVVQVIDFGREDGLLFLVMERVHGVSLSRLALDRFPLPASRVADIGIQVLRALEEAHTRGVIHRDLKPDNVLVARTREGADLVKVVDFGTAILEEPDDSFRTREGLLIGTPSYMSPEQCRSKELDARSDLYAFGCLLYFLLAGRPPFRAENALDVMVAHLYHDPEPPSRVVPEVRVSPALEALTLWCLAKLPLERPPSASALRAELENAVSRGLFTPIHVPGPVRTGGRKGPRGARSARIATGGPTFDGAEEDPGAVLVVATDHADTDQVIETLRARGGRVEVVSSPPSSDTLDPFDVLVLDGTPETLQEGIRAGRARGVPALVCGPEDDLAAMASALEAGAYDFIPLPVNPRALARSIARAVRARRRGNAS